MKNLFIKKFYFNLTNVFMSLNYVLINSNLKLWDPSFFKLINEANNYAKCWTLTLANLKFLMLIYWLLHHSSNL